MSRKRQNYQEFAPRLSIFKSLPTFVYMKAKEMPCYSAITEHKHNWDQLIYALEGVLEIKTESGNYIIPSHQAVWIPSNKLHSISTINGARLRSVHITNGIINTFSNDIKVLKVNELARILIATASSFEFDYSMSEEELRLLQVLVDQISNFKETALRLPLSNDPLLLPILDWQQLYPDENRSLTYWSNELGASSKTIARRFETELGMSFTLWREQLKLHTAIHWLNEKRPVTQIALDLGYQSLSAFIHMFKKNMGETPGKFNN